MKIRCICIDDANRPPEIPADKWVVLEEEYHITNVSWQVNQGLQGCDIYEKPLDESCAPYECFQLRRFAILKDDEELFRELVKLCTEMNDVDVSKLIEESGLVVQEKEEVEYA